MEGHAYLKEKYTEAASMLSPRIRSIANKILDEKKLICEEIRMSIGEKVILTLVGGNEMQLSATVEKYDIEYVLQCATDSSVYSHADSMRCGYITARGGHRIGLCGSVSLKNGQVYSIKEISSICIRIAKQIKGVAAEPLSEILSLGGFDSTLIAGSPGSGKTTVLRDMIRILSNGCKDCGISGCRVGIADERGEIAGMYSGKPQMDIGKSTDVLDGAPKKDAVMMLLRSMSPEVIALDEITAPEDAAAIECASNCGVKILASAHVFKPDDLIHRPIYRKLINNEIFKYVIYIHRSGKQRKYSVIESDKIRSLYA